MDSRHQGVAVDTSGSPVVVRAVAVESQVVTPTFDQSLSDAAVVFGNEGGQGMGFVSARASGVPASSSQCDITVRSVTTGSILPYGSPTHTVGSGVGGGRFEHVETNGRSFRLGVTDISH